jgi:dTDP-4-amino-4,6-dideoxygalactose transaminase
LEPAVIPPIAVPTSPGRIARSFLTRTTDGKAGFHDALASSTGRSRVALFGSGRAALAAAVAPLRRDDRDEVLVPAYTCWTVPAAVVRAGLRVRVVDVDPATLDLDAASVDRAALSRVAAVVTAHLFSRSSDVGGWCRRFRSADPSIRVIEDAAQAWPDPRVNAADAVVLSFGRGKPVALGGGGALLDGAAAAAAEARLREGGAARMAALAAAALLGGPATYRIPASIPALGLGETVYEPAFDMSAAMFAWQARLGTEELSRLPEYRGARRDNARFLAERFQDLPAGWGVLGGTWEDGPIRYPLLAPSREIRDRVLGSLRSQGIAASRMYPGTLAQIPELTPHLANPLEPLPGAERVRDALLTLPVYPHLTGVQRDRIVTALRRAARES